MKNSNDSEEKPMNYFPKATKENIKELLLTACEVSGKSYSDRILELYWETLREISLRDIRKAFLAFNACATFPSAAKVMAYCGYTPPETEPREHRHEPAQEPEKPNNTFQEVYGSWTFEARYIGESKVGAEDEFNRCRQKLLGAGWKIEHEIPFDCIAETQVGKHIRKERLSKLHFVASRPDPKAPPPMKDVRTVAAMEQMQQKMAHRASAAELANKVLAKMEGAR
jgi:hypothetical protein